MEKKVEVEVYLEAAKETEVEISQEAGFLALPDEVRISKRWFAFC
jgi:hypothetical protein